MRQATVILCVISMLLPLASQAQGKKKIQCWTDERGHRSCGDRVPPQYAKTEREIINERGVVVGTKSRQKTAEEIAEEERKAQAEAEAQKQAQAKVAYDRFLIDSYSSIKDLETARDLRLQMTDGRIQLAEKALADSQKTLKDLKDQVAAATAAKKEPDKKLLGQVRKFEKAVAENSESVTQLQRDREQTQIKFAQDIQRFRELKQLPAPSPAQPAPPPTK